MNDTDAPILKKREKRVLLLLGLALILIIIAIFGLKQCSGELSGGEGTDTNGNERELIAARRIGQLMDSVPDGAGPFGAQAPDGEIYFINRKADGAQILTDPSGVAIYEFEPDRKVYVAGFSNGRVLLLLEPPDTAYTDPKQTWDVRQHLAVSISAPNLGMFPIFHSAEDVEAVLATMKDD